MKVLTSEALQLLHDGAKALSKVESNGIRIDTDYLDKTLKETELQIRELEFKLREDEVWHRWVKKFGQRSNLSSKDQLGKLLYDKRKNGGMGYACVNRTRTNRPKVSEAVISKIDLPFCKTYIELTRLQKARGTFLCGIRRETCDGYLHPMFSLNLAHTFRSTSNLINFQNLPVRNPQLSRMIRQCFIARKGCRIAEVDYSGIEVCVAACYNKDPNLIRYIEDPTTDMHRDTAMRLAFLEEKQVSKAMRHTAKNRFVFPQFYGSYYVDCARNIWEALEAQNIKVEGSEESVGSHLAKKGIQTLGRCDDSDPVPDTFEHHVKTVEDWFWQKRFKVYTEWKERWWAQYLRRGWFKMKTGFVCGGVYKRNQVINYPVQGSAFHCLLLSLILIQEWLDKNGMRTKIVGQIHDSIVFDMHDDEVQDVLTKTRYIMTNIVPKMWPWIIVPLKIEAEVAPLGGSWADKAVWVRKNGKWGPKE